MSSGGVSSVEETKSGVVVHRKKASNSLVGVKQHNSQRRAPNSKPRVRTLSNSEMSSQSDNQDQAGNTKIVSATDEHHNDNEDMSDGGDSWTVSHDMNMIDEVHTSEESDQNNQNNNNNNLSSRHRPNNEQKQRQTFFNLGLVETP